MMLCRSKWITLALLLVTVGVDAASYSARKREEPSLSRSSASQDAVRSNHYPGGTLKRTAYTGRYCAYTKTKMVQHKVPNGTETYLKQVRTKCSWSAVYCTPRVSYVVSTRRTFKTVMRNVSKEVWACCPGFEGENCDNACYNCTTISDLNDRVAALEEQIIGRLPLHQKDESLTSSERGGSDSKGEPGPIGPRGPSGETGAIGPRGPTGLPGQKGAEGRSGARGEVGPHGPMGANGQKGEPGLRGPQGPAGIDGVNGIDGLDGVPGRKGSAGLPGLPGLIGQKGEAGTNGRDGEAGVEGPPGPAGPRGMIGGQGPQGEPGRPGPPGQCGCQQAEAETTPRPPPTKTTPAAAPEVTTGEIASGDPSSNGSVIQESGSHNQQNNIYCDTILWRHPMAKLSCDFGPVKRQKGAKRRKRSLKAEKDLIRKLIKKRFQRHGGSPAYYVADDMRTTEEFGELSLDEPKDYITMDDMSSIQDSGGTTCAWNSTINSETTETAWKLQRLIDIPLTPDYFTDFLHELATDEEFQQTSETESTNSEISPQNSNFSQNDDDPLFFTEDQAQESIDEAYIADLFDYIDSTPQSIPNDRHRKKRSGDKMNNLMYSNGPPFDSTTESTTGDGYYLIWNAKSPISNSNSNMTDQFYSPYFFNTFSDICLNFQYFIHTNSVASKSKDIDGGLLVYLLPCDPSYQVPVLNLTGSSLKNNTDRWVHATVPLPSNLLPYRAIFEGVRPKYGQKGENISQVSYVALDDIVLSECGYRACFYAGAYHNEDEMWTNEICEQCFCLDGAVTCLEITCPELECKYKYRPEGYCCDMCCRYQGEPSTDDSGDLSGDGEYETMLPDGDYDDDYNETSIDYTNMFISKNDSYGCPLPFEDDNTDAHPIDRCELRKDPGPCNRRYQRYYFDKVQQDCRLFMYGGCEGNANQFLTRQECLSVCQNQPSNKPAPGSLRDSACDDIPAVEGACKMLDLYFTYDRSTGRCHRFQYHGCGSSRNRFQTPNQCRSACNAGDPVYPGFVTQGGFIKDEPSSPAEIIMDVDVCSLPVETTNCKGSFHRYYYDQETRSCVEFGWGGCPETGPVNRFMTEEECNRKCRDNAGSSPMMKRRSPRCYEPKSEGNCLMHLIRFYYDADEDRCTKFTFGGCHGNRNRFVTPWDCREECGGGDPIIYDDSDICSMPVQIGKCRGILRRYYYDQKTARCIVFGWGGCEVNGPENRFDTEEECNRRCASQTITSRTVSIPSTKCTEPVHPGPCRAHVYRFYYDPDTEQCSTFIYGGCNANGNNFASPEECKQQCGALTVNYTVTEPVEMQQNPGPTEGGNQRGERGPPGPPGIGIKGDTGPPGPPGPKADSATLDRYAEEIQFLKDQLTEITKMVLSHVGDMEKHSPAPTDGTDSESEDGESEFTIPPVDYFTNLEGSK